MEAINKFRDCFEKDLNDATSRQALTSFVTGYLQREGLTTNAEIIYILFLYLARLDGERLSAPLLLNSIILKTHLDIKISNEAKRQLYRFKMAEESAIQGIIEDFLV